jgi:DNA-binding CsgD family transcriptional regulator
VAREAKIVNGWLEEIRDLKLSYMATHRMLGNKKRALQAEIEKLSNGIPIRRAYDKKNKGVFHRVKEDHSNLFAELKEIEGMITDVNFAIQMMHTGRLPGSRRGVERRAAYQKNKLMDPVRMQAFTQQSTAGSPANITEDERTRIEMALCTLSGRERECYELAHGMGFKPKAIAVMLEIGEGSVKEYIERAHRKVSAELENNLFLRR